MVGYPSVLLRRVGDASPNSVALVSAALMAALGLADVATGPEISSSVFYVLPVGLTAWYAGSVRAYALCVLAAATWFWADAASGGVYSAAWIPLWNAGVRLAFFLIIADLLVRLRRSNDAQRRLAEVDPLTGLANTRRFFAAVDLEVARSVRYRRAVSLGYIDLDGFKGVNDRWGHQTGDEVLEAIGRTLRAQLRQTDLPARLGGDEFAVLFPETDAPAAREAVENLRATLEALVAESGWPVGFSIGVLTTTGGTATGQDLIRGADALMYEVKRSGKGRSTYRIEGGESA